MMATPQTLRAAAAALEKWERVSQDPTHPAFAVGFTVGWGWHGQSYFDLKEALTEELRPHLPALLTAARARIKRETNVALRAAGCRPLP